MGWKIELEPDNRSGGSRAEETVHQNEKRACKLVRIMKIFKQTEA